MRFRPRFPTGPARTKPSVDVMSAHGRRSPSFTTYKLTWDEAEAALLLADQIEDLRGRAPDLADRVEAKKLSIGEAQAASLTAAILSSQPVYLLGAVAALAVQGVRPCVVLPGSVADG
jgi:hypothetical protein